MVPQNQYLMDMTEGVDKELYCPILRLFCSTIPWISMVPDVFHLLQYTTRWTIHHDPINCSTELL